jgi:hypothetical protein
MTLKSTLGPSTIAFVESKGSNAAPTTKRRGSLGAISD